MPALPHQFDRFDLEICVEHPMVRPTQVSQVIGFVVPRTVVEMGDRQAGLDLKATDDATDEWIMLPRDAASCWDFCGS